LYINICIFFIFLFFGLKSPFGGKTLNKIIKSNYHTWLSYVYGYESRLHTYFSLGYMNLLFCSSTHTSMRRFYAFHKMKRIIAIGWGEGIEEFHSKNYYQIRKSSPILPRWQWRHGTWSRHCVCVSVCRMDGCHIWHLIALKPPKEDS